MACAKYISAFSTSLRQIESLSGFQRPQFLLWTLLGGTAARFALHRIAEIDIDGVLCRRLIPGECLLFKPGEVRNRVAVTAHIGTVLPALILAVFQFLPALRRWSSTLHRVNGYIILLLVCVGGISGIVVARDAFGGTLEMQTVMVLSALMIVGSLGLAMWYIKRQQVEKHRAWMLRAWAIAGHVITMRILTRIMIPLAAITDQARHVVRSCAAVDHMFKGNATAVRTLYPPCQAFYAGSASDQHVLIRANISSTRPDHIAASAGVVCASSAWLALLLHCIAVEVYLAWPSMTADEKLGSTAQLTTSMPYREPLDQKTEGHECLATWGSTHTGALDIVFD
ncbi:putative membrane protein (DUF2306) domain-containing protein [Sarocladium implicatum]|nr:putative membrane protein (DUF2306) domain-containing protein [Sarocladium implicatum]